MLVRRVLWPGHMTAVRPVGRVERVVRADGRNTALKDRLSPRSLEAISRQGRLEININNPMNNDKFHSNSTQDFRSGTLFIA